MTEPLVSHGRGGEDLTPVRSAFSPCTDGSPGAANISKDSTLYTDGDIVREGPIGDQGNGAYSAGVSSPLHDVTTPS